MNKAFENKVRLGIMSVLMVNESVDFTELKNLLGVTDGNLAGHIKYLEKSEFISFEKAFIDNKPNTKYMATKKGRDAFTRHIKAIENLLK
nr:transcriptional regulator [Marinigracilibium pacificum]